MTRRTTRSPHPGAVLRAGRGTHGYSGASADTLNDPAPVFPPRQVVVPQSATTPLSADGETIGGGSGPVRLVDLGILNAVDLIGGPVTLYTPDGPEFVSIVIGSDGFVQHDSDSYIKDTFFFGDAFTWSSSDTQAFYAAYHGSQSNGIVIDEPIAFALEEGASNPSVGSIHLYALVVTP